MRHAVVLGALAAGNLVALGIALALGSGTVRDGQAAVTTGNVVALGIAATLLVVLLAPFLRLSPRVTRHIQVYALTAQIAHAVGHLAGLYASFRPYDDVLHAALTAWGALLFVDLARGWRVFPRRVLTPWRAAVLAATAGVALTAVWEIFEYTADQMGGTREQDDLDDTMRDMIMGSVGALAAASALFAWLLRRGPLAPPGAGKEPR